MNEARIGARLRWRLFLAIACGVVFCLSLTDVALSWATDTSLERVLKLVIALYFGVSALDYAQRRIVFTPASIRIRYLFLWKSYPVPPTADIQDWGHSIGFVDPISHRPIFILSRAASDGTVGLDEIRAARTK